MKTNQFALSHLLAPATDRLDCSTAEGATVIYDHNNTTPLVANLCEMVIPRYFLRKSQTTTTRGQTKNITPLNHAAKRYYR